MAITDFFKKKDHKKKGGKTAVRTEDALKQAEEMLGGQMPDITDEMIDQMIDGSLPGMPKVGAMQKIALRGLKKMDMKKRREVFAEAFGKMHANGGDSKEEMLKQIEQMRANGQLNSKQYKIAKKRLGIKE